MLNHLKRAAVAAAAAAALAAALAACNSTKDNADGATSAPASTVSAKATATHAKAAKQSDAAQFKAYVAKHGTAQEQAAARHVSKIQGADSLNNIADTASVYTDYTGTLATENGHATLLAGSFKDWEASRGKTSKNGLVTVYSASGQTLGAASF